MKPARDIAAEFVDQSTRIRYCHAWELKDEFTELIQQVRNDALETAAQRCLVLEQQYRDAAPAISDKASRNAHYDRACLCGMLAEEIRAMKEES